MIYGSGNVKVTYSYDSYGKKVTVTGTLSGTLGALNPYRYRGYIYDEETGFYYLNSRYYDPETGRFISSDVMLSTGQGVTGHNSYAYCLNDPINTKDDDGTRAGNIVLKNEGCGMSRHAVIYDVPSYKQGRTSLCWAYSEIMIESYRTNIKLSYDETVERAMNIAIERQRFIGRYGDWNRGGWPLNRGREISASNITNAYDLYDILKEYGPVYGYYYDKDNKDAHMTVITGVIPQTNTVFTNNP